MERIGNFCLRYCAAIIHTGFQSSLADASVALRVMFLARALGAGASTTWGMLFGRADVTTNEVTTNEVLLKNALILQSDLLDRKRGREQAMQDMVADLKDKLKSEKRLKTEATNTLEETEELVDGLFEREQPPQEGAVRRASSSSRAP